MDVSYVPLLFLVVIRYKTDKKKKDNKAKHKATGKLGCRLLLRGGGRCLAPGRLVYAWLKELIRLVLILALRNLSGRYN